MDIDELIKSFHLRSETHKIIENDSDYLDLVTKEQYWEALFDLSLDNVQMRDYFNTLKPEEREEYFQFGISCLFCFIQKNFTGPPLPKSVDEFLEKEMFKSVDFPRRLQMNNEDINVNTKHPSLLVISTLIFECCVVMNLVNFWWSCRALSIHQEVLEEPSPMLLAHANRLSKLLHDMSVKGQIKAELDVELAQLFLRFRQANKSKDFIESACNILGLEYSLTGKSGKKIQCQENESAQLGLNIYLHEKEGIRRPEIDDFIIPKHLSLNDDVRLDKVEFSESINNIKLPNTEQKLVLCIVQQKIISSPQDELQVEELLPFLEAILNQKNTYSVRIAALLLRWRFERKNKRTVDKCIKQCEDIVNSFTKEKPHALNRIGDVFGTPFSPTWKTEAKYADILLNFGLVQNALDMFMRVKSWEEVYVCYSVLKSKHKAAEVFKEQLAIKPSVKLMCLLGDATDDVTCYEKAWDMSKRRSHRAQKHWGLYFFSKKNYQEAIPHLERSTSINPIQAKIWLCLGFAAVAVENWPTASTAYRRYTNLEPDSFEGWNNLAQAYVKIGNKLNAHPALNEALRCNSDNWKVWENLLVISSDINHFKDIIKAYHRLLDLKQKYLNVDVLNALVYNVCNDSNDSEGNPAGVLLQKTRELVGRVTALYPTNGAVWELYASLAPITLLRAQRLQRAYRGYTQAGWDKSPKSCYHVLNVCSKLSGVVLDDAIDPANTILSSVKVNLSAALSAAKKRNYEETKGLEKEVETQLEQIIEKMKKANSAIKIDVS